MKELKLSRNSWHYHLVSNYTTYHPDTDIKDFCAYVRAIFVAMVSISCIIALVSLFLYVLVVQELMYINSGFDELYLKDNDWLIIGLIIWFLGLIGTFWALLSYVTKTIYKRIMKPKTSNYNHIDKPDSLFYNVYKKYNDKVCYKIKIVD